MHCKVIQESPQLLNQWKNDRYVMILNDSMISWILLTWLQGNTYHSFTEVTMSCQSFGSPDPPFSVVTMMRDGSWKLPSDLLVAVSISCMTDLLVDWMISELALQILFKPRGRRIKREKFSFLIRTSLVVKVLTPFTCVYIAWCIVYLVQSQYR